MTLRIFVSRDAGAVAVGADEVALVLGLAARKRGTEIEIVRTGSRGLYWLEPMIEVATPAMAQEYLDFLNGAQFAAAPGTIRPSP